jgi:protoporphyrinogen IX oxidase
MANLYFWLKFGHLAGLAVFLFGHGISAGCSFGLRERPAAASARALLRLSQWSYRVTYPGLLLLIVTGVWMGFAGGWWGQAWIWAGIGVLVALFVLMGILSIPYHRARKASDDVALEEQMARTRPALMSWIGAAGLLALIFLMVFKPF